MDNRLSQNVQNIRWHHKVHWREQGKIKGGIDSRRKNSAELEIQEGLLQGDALSPLVLG